MVNKFKDDTENEGVEDAWSWKIPEHKPEYKPNWLGDESSFSLLFPKYREKYLKDYWPLVQKAFQDHFIKAELDLVSGTMTVRTTMKTWDPYMIIKARDVIKLLARSVPYEQAIRVMQDEISCDIIRIKNMVRQSEKFIKRRNRLMGPNNCTLKSLELLTNCYILVQGATVSAVGPYRGLLEVRRITEETMNNIHPIYNIKALMIKKEIMKDPNLKNEDWSRFLPKIQAKASNKKIAKKNKVRRVKKEYTPFPPPMPEAKIDKQLASGEYFELQKERKKRRLQAKTEKQQEKVEQNKRKREAEFVPPTETVKKAKTASNKADVDVTALRKKVKAAVGKK